MWLVHFFWYLLTPTNRWDQVWKTTVMVVLITGNVALIDIMFGFSVSGQLWVYFTSILTLQLPLIFAAQFMISKQNSLEDRLRKMAQTDALTGLDNRRAFFRKVKRDVFGQLILLDVDFFKQVNDAFGHDFGDDVLKTVAHFMKHKLPEDGVLARFGGEEFVIFLPRASKSDANDLAAQIVKGVATQNEQENIHVTLSAGVMQVDRHVPLVDALRAADEALYQAKSDGRACFRPVPPDKIAA